MRKGIFALIFLTCLGISSLLGCGRTGQEQNLGKKEQETKHGEPDDQKARQQSPQDGNTETEHNTTGKEDDITTPAVYMTAAISPDGLMGVYQALQASPEGKVAVKLSTGEPGSNYLRTDLIADLVQSLNASIVECNTAYGGSRANTAMHYQVAEDHGYTEIADVDIMDEDGSMILPVTGGRERAYSQRRYGWQYLGRRTGCLFGIYGRSGKISCRLSGWKYPLYKRDESAVCRL